MSAYARFAGLSLAAMCRDALPAGASIERAREKELNRTLRGYPRNHRYRVWNGELVPGLRLYRRLRALAPLYPERVSSFLDVGSCKGFFVFDAARRAGCERAVGIDVYEPFVQTSNEVRTIVGAERTRFHTASLEQVAEDPGAFGGPFHVVNVLNVYHYLFWGSGLDATAARDHRVILSRLAKVCSGQVIFSSPLEVEQCPGDIKRAAEKAGSKLDYNEAGFVKAAEEFFDVRRVGAWGRRPVFVMSKAGAA